MNSYIFPSAGDETPILYLQVLLRESVELRINAACTRGANECGVLSLKLVNADKRPMPTPDIIEQKHWRCRRK